MEGNEKGTSSPRWEKSEGTSSINIQQLTSKSKKKQPGLPTKSRSTYGNVVLGNSRGKSPKPSTSQSGKDSQSPMKGGKTSNASSKESKGNSGYKQHDVSFDGDPKMSAVKSQPKKKQQVFLTEATTKTQRLAAGNVVPESFRRVSPKPSPSKSGKDSQSPKKLEKPSKPSSKEQKGNSGYMQHDFSSNREPYVSAVKSTQAKKKPEPLTKPKNPITPKSGMDSQLPRKEGQSSMQPSHKYRVEQYSSYEVERHTSHTKLQGIKRKEPEPFKTMRPTAEKSKNKSPKPSTFISGKDSFIQSSSRKHRADDSTGSVQPAKKRLKKGNAGNQSDLVELDFKVVFALDFSKTVSEANLLKQFTFSQEISDYWKISPERSTTALVVYGESAETIPVDVNSMKMSVPQQSRSEHRRMDLALKEAASHFSGNTTQNKLIMLMTSGNQFSGADGHKDDQKLLSSIIEELYSRNIKVLIVPVGLGADFKDLRLKRPQSLFPLTCFEDMRNDTAKKVANVIMTIINTRITDADYDIPELVYKRSKPATSQDQDSSLSTESLDKGKQSRFSRKVSTNIPQSPGRPFALEKSTLPSRSIGGSKSRQKGWNPTILSLPEQRASNGNFYCEVQFALDYSSGVSEEEFQREIDFVRHMSKSWNPEYELEAAVVYGNVAERVPLHAVGETSLRQRRGRRIDLALTKAANCFTSSANEQLIILITAGRQVSDAENKEGNKELLLSASQALSSANAKVILVPVGKETDFQELGLIVRRPQHLFPLDSFDEMTPQKAMNIASYITETVDLESYAIKKVHEFSDVPQDLSLWEASSICSDVVEGAWYELYEAQRQPNKRNKQNEIKMLIRESIDNFQSTLVTECRVCITLAVLGPLGVGKSFFLNSVLNLGLTDNVKVKNGPLPSALNDSQTPIPIYVRYGRKVQVFFHKQETDPNPDLWFPRPQETINELDKDTLVNVEKTLRRRFQEKKTFTSASFVELRGPFPVFVDLKTRRMSRKGLHLELEIDVEFVDVPGLGDDTGNAAISGILSKADVVLFFGSGQSGRPVSPEDIAQVFRRRDRQFEFASRPKLVHIFNDRSTSPPTLHAFHGLWRERKQNLDKAWSYFRSDIRDGDGIYKEAREKLPKLNSEDVLDKMSEESECIYFHAKNIDLLPALKKVVDKHVGSVKIKQTVHPFLQNVHWAAKMLKKRVLDSLCRTRKHFKPNWPIRGDIGFEILSTQSENEENELITSFLENSHLPLESNFQKLQEFLYRNFLLSPETQTFLVKVLKKSLKSYLRSQINSFLNSHLGEREDVPGDILQLTERLGITKVKRFCENYAPAYLLKFWIKKKSQITLTNYEVQLWEAASVDEKRDLVRKYLHLLLNRAFKSLKNTREKQAGRTSHIELMEELCKVVEKLQDASSLKDAHREDCLESLKEKLPKVIKFCNDTIREINPHPNLDVHALPSLPEKMINAKEDDKIPSQSSYEKIVNEVKRIANEMALNRDEMKADAIRKLEKKLGFKQGFLKLPRLENHFEQRSWVLALLNVLSDKDHFDIQLPSTIVLDPRIEENESLVNVARRRLFAHQNSSINCKVKIVEGQFPSEDEIKLVLNAPEKCLEALVSPSMSNNLKTILEEFRDPTQQLAPIFIPITSPDIPGNYFLDEDPWSKASLIHEEIEEQDEETKRDSNQGSVLKINVFLVVEPGYINALKSTVNNLRCPNENDVKLTYVVLPQNGRGIGVTRSIIKRLAECFKFSLYWTLNDNIKFMYHYVEDDLKWHKCPITWGLLFGQRVFQSCLEKTIKKDLPRSKRDDLFDHATERWESWAKQPKRDARQLILDDKCFSEMLKNPNLLHSPFANISEICDGDPDKEIKLMAYEHEFVATCKDWLFEDTINRISGVSLAHITSKKSDLMSRYPKADYMLSEQQSQVVLNNGDALKGKNFVSDEVIFCDEELQIYDEDKRNDPYWGIKESEDSLRRALLVNGVVGYRVIRIVYKDKN